MAQDHFERHGHHVGVIDWNFNVVFDEQPSIVEMAKAYRPFLQKPELYEPIPDKWLHATILKVGTTEQYTEDEMLAVAEKVQNRLSGIKFPRFHFGDLKIIHGNVAFAIEPEKELEKLYIAVSESLEEVVGAERTTQPPYGHFLAHCSLVYTKNRKNEAETEAELRAANITPASFHIHHMPLITQKPTNGHYEWEIVKDIVVE
jgi:hypothetical protein